MSKVYICDFALNCHLGKSKAEVAQRLLIPDIESPKLNILFQVTQRHFSNTNKLGDLRETV